MAPIGDRLRVDGGLWATGANHGGSRGGGRDEGRDGGPGGGLSGGPDEDRVGGRDEGPTSDLDADRCGGPGADLDGDPGEGPGGEHIGGRGPGPHVDLGVDGGGLVRPLRTFRRPYRWNCTLQKNRRHEEESNFPAESV